MIKSKKMRRWIALGVLVSLPVVGSHFFSLPVSADENTRQLETQTSTLKTELNGLNAQLATLAKELDESSAEVERLAAEIEKSKLDLAAAQVNETHQYETMKERIKFMYEGGNISLLQILFSSENMTDFLNKAEYVNTISEYDRSMLKELQVVRENVQEKQTALEKKQTDLKQKQEALTSKKDNLLSKISSTSGELSGYQAQLDRARAAENALRTATTQQEAARIQIAPANLPDPNKVVPPAPSPSPTPTPAPTPPPVNNGEVALFAAILECEAGGHPDGLLAVATVIMNRVSDPRFPNSIQGVVYQTNQFEPVSSGFLSKVLNRGPSALAYSTAQAALAGQRHGSVANCLFFNAAWTGRQGINIGGNVFW